MKYTAEYPLKPYGVSNCLQFIEETLEKYKLNQRDLMEALLISEEALLLLEEHAPDDCNIKLIISKPMGIPRIKILIPGTALDLDEHVGTVSLDQLGAESESTIRGVMLRSYSDSIKYRHGRTLNSLTITTGIPERILSVYTVSAILLAVITGLLFMACFPKEAAEWVSFNILDPIETLFISALMCVTAPAVFVSITCSMFRFEGFSELGRSGKIVIGSYLVTSVFATIVGVLCFLIFKPGEVGILASQTVGQTAEDFSFLSILTTLIPPNIIEPFISVNSLQLMITALIIGAALTTSGKRVSQIKSIFEELDVLCGKVSSMLMQIVPVAVYCSTANVILSSRTKTFLSTAELIGTLLVAFVLMLVVYCLILLGAGRLNPITFLTKYAPTMKNTFLKGSGVAAVPMTMRVCRRRFGVPQSICSFSIPLGSTINMDGNCVCLIITSLFFTRVCDVSLDFNGVIILFFLVLVLSLGAPIAPGTLILCLVTLMAQLGISTSVVSLIIGINFILEMLVGMVNTVGDVVISLVVSRNEGSLDLKAYNRK